MPRVRKEFVDFDYIEDLPPKLQEYMNEFAGEYYGANLDFKNLRKNHHRNKRLKKDCTDRVNSMNRDLLGVSQINGLLETSIEKEYIHPAQYEGLHEDAMIEYIDAKKRLTLKAKQTQLLEGEEKAADGSNNSKSDLEKLKK